MGGLAAVLESLLPLLTNYLRMMLFIHAGKIVVGVLGFFGLSMVADHYVIDPAMQIIRDMMTNGPGGQFGTRAIAYLGILRLDQAVSMMLSAWTVVQGIKQGKIMLAKVTS